MLKRKEYKANLKDPLRDPVNHPREEVTDGSGNLYSSELAHWADAKNQRHAPTLDIDFPCELIESSTEGHFHLYIDVPMSWGEYEMLLAVLQKVGICQAGFVQLSLARGASFVRKPGVKKGEGESDS